MAACGVLDVGRCGAARTTLSLSLSLQGIVLQSPGVSTSAVLQSTHYNQHVPRLEVNPELPLFLMQKLLDGKINRLPPPLKVMESCSSPGWRGQRRPLKRWFGSLLPPSGHRCEGQAFPNRKLWHKHYIKQKNKNRNHYYIYALNRSLKFFRGNMTQHWQFEVSKGKCGLY